MEIKQFLNRLSDKTKFTVAGLLLALLLYFVGVKFVLFPAIVVLLVVYLPLPAVFSSWFGRVFISSVIGLSILQIAATFQFLLFPNSNFVALAAIATLFAGLLLFLAPPNGQKKRRIFSKFDAMSLIVMLFFVLPVLAFLYSGNPLTRIGEIGSIQAIDATNHYAGLAEMTKAEHLNYAFNFYYPKGFHISSGFLQNTIFTDQFSLGWVGNATLYIGHYIVLGCALAYGVYFLCLSAIRALSRKASELKEVKVGLIVALSVGPPLALLYLIPFIAQGFLNFYYICLAIVCGVLVLLELKKSAQEPVASLSSSDGRWVVLLYLLLIFGASVSWPLLIPPLLLVGLMVLMPSNFNLKALFKQAWDWRNIPIFVALLIQLIPIYFQLAFTADSSQGINLTGGLRAFHPYILLLGALLVGGWLLYRKAEGFSKLIFSLYIPMISFVALLVFFQLFTVGEVRYYGLKTSLILEVLILALFVVTLVYSYVSTNKFDWKFAIFLPVIPVFMMVLLVTNNLNPLKDARDAFRTYSKEGKPGHYDKDVNTFVRLGEEGKIKHFNSTVLHYEAEKKLFVGHMQTPFWANMMQYDSSERDFKALHCTGALYSNLGFGTFSATEQEFLIGKIKDCAQKVHDFGDTYYLITDTGSIPVIKDALGDAPVVIVDNNQ